MPVITIKTEEQLKDLYNKKIKKDRDYKNLQKNESLFIHDVLTFCSQSSTTISAYQERANLYLPLQIKFAKIIFWCALSLKILNANTEVRITRQ